MFEAFLAFSNDFHRVDAERLKIWIAKNVPNQMVSVAWHDAALNWADKLRDDIGGDYRVTSSSESVVLSAESQEITDWIHNYISRSIRAISARLGDVAWRKNERLKLFLSFAEEDDYYHYIAPY
ncbi:MAG TPA: hypothetical protein VI282_20000, partial [Verrucomicrobiae bacterium]